MQTRRQWIHMMGSGLLVPGLAGCTALEIPDTEPLMEVDAEVHWARREEWQGEEVAFGVVGLGGRYLMVKQKSPLGWTFPGGLVNRQEHGVKSETNDDLFDAALLHTYNQALISLEIEGSALFAYGYGVDVLNDRTVMVHWYRLSPKTVGLPSITANLALVDDARWVSDDSSYLRHCLVKRREEYIEAGQGRTIMLEGCS